jgi:hypothetical protein
MKSNQFPQTTSVTWPTSVVPVYGFGMGGVCPMELNREVLISTDKRHASAAQATVWGPQPWSPPVT